MTMPEAANQALPARRLATGAAIFVCGQLAPLLIPLVAVSQLSTEWKTGLSGLLLLGVPELSILAAVAILGRPGFDFLKARIFGVFRRFAPPAAVGPARYRIGLVMFCLPLLFGLVQPYAGHLIPGYPVNQFAFAIAGDVLLVASLLVLGGDFWDKLRALFIRNAKAEFPTRRS